MKTFTQRSTIVGLTVLLTFWSFVAFSQAQKISFEDSWNQHGIQILNQSPTALDLNFSLEEYSLNTYQVDKHSMEVITMKGVILPNNEGAPDIPAYSKYVAIPQGASVSVNLLNKRTEISENMEIAPAARLPKDNETTPIFRTKDHQIYATNALYPSNIITVSEPMKIRGVDVVLVSVSPFQYNPVSKQLLVHRDLEISLDFKGGNGQFGDNRLRSRWWDPIVKDMVINHESLPEINHNSSRALTGCEYLIISPDDATFLAWADSIRIFRHKQGITTQVVTTTEIGGNNNAAIEIYINDAYNTWDIPPAAVLLLGDYGTSGTTITSPIYDNYCASDNIFADVDNDHMADIIFARMTAQNAVHLETMIGKALNYERNPPVNPDFYNNPITAMGWQTERWFQMCSEIIAGYFENEHGKATVRENAIYQGNSSGPWSTAQNTNTILAEFGPNGLGYIPQSPSYLTDWGGNATRINNDINSGAFILQHRDHGSETGWGEPAYNTSNISGTQNTDLTFIFSVNCLTGKFNISGECFAEAFHRHEYGALGLIAATEVSYSFVNDTYVWGMYDNMWPDFMPDYGTTPESRDVLPAFGNVAGKYFLQQSSWPYNVSNKEVTYHLFHHHGDAFQTVYYDMPQDVDVTHEDIMLSTMDYFTIDAEEGALICLSIGEDILAVAEGTGDDLDIQIPLQEPGVIFDVIITKQNRFRYEAEVEVIPPNGPYCMYDEHSLTDSLANDNGIIEFDEEILVSLMMKNLGSEDADDVEVTLETICTDIEFIDSTESYGAMTTGSYVNRDDAFRLHISDGIPDQTEVQFDVVARDINDSTWTSKFFMMVNAPEIVADELLIDDSQAGNDNGYLDPGETAIMKVKMINEGHCPISDVLCSMQPFNQYITMMNDEFLISSLGLFGATWATFEVEVAADAPTGIIAEMRYNASAAGYSVDKVYFPKIGSIIEDWETGDFSKFDWQHAGDVQWDVTNQYPYEGFYHAKSGALQNGETSELKITYEVMGSDVVRFYKKVSSEVDFDELKFYIDGNLIQSWSGTTEGWTQESFPISVGVHTMRWVYEKDFNGAGGGDCAWVDYIELPAMMVTTIFAGPDDEICEGIPYQCLGSSTNFSTINWTTSGDGSFDFNNILMPLYTPGPQDYIDGNTTLTMTIVDIDGDTYEDEMLLTYLYTPEAPETPEGPDYIDVYKVTETDYTTSLQSGANAYLWELIPEEAGTVVGDLNNATVYWDINYLGEATLQVASVNDCGVGDYSEALEIMVDNTVGVHELGNAIDLQILPNPNNGDFLIQLESSLEDEMIIRLTNYVGVDVFVAKKTVINGSMSYRFEKGQFPTGIYMLSIEQAGKTHSEKIVISK